MDKIALNELQYVEEPFLRQLKSLGWKTIHGDKYDPFVSLREGFHEYFLEKELAKSLKQINPWLEDDQISEVIRKITTPQNNNLLEANQEIQTMLLEGISVSENRKTGESSPSVQFIDFKKPSNNSFIAISQFKVNILGTQKHIIPDIVLFINGLPVVVVECKSPYIADPVTEGIIQLFRYMNKRGVREGNERLFWHNQFVVSTCRQTAKYSTITGNFDHFVEWKDPYPYKLSDIQTGGEDVVNSQQVLIQGMLSRKNLVDIIHSFTVFKEQAKGKTIKLVPRYQQFRTVQKIVKNLKSNKSQEEKGGIVWHTQGSGKSLTMMFTVRKMYHDPKLAGFKVVFITDRKDLEKQLKETSKSVGYTVKVAKNISKLKEYLKTNTPDLVMGMIHKFQERETMQEFPVLNTSEKTLVLIDEAHRTQYKFLGANLHKSLPNSVKIAFTGTPIEKTERTFGDYIDKYTIKQSVEDGFTVEIIYEGRTHKGEVSDREAMNVAFEDVFGDVDKETKRKILGRYTWRAYLEAEEVVRDKARDMIDHYVNQVFPNRFKAQVVTTSRLAAHRYKLALRKAKEEKIKEWQVSGGKQEDINLLKKMRIEAVMTASPNELEFKEYADADKRGQIIEGFKLSFESKKGNYDGNIGMIVVQSMLITGFDAPMEQVMYLDNVLREHTLLQAIARVNRKETNKECGFIVDYVGVARHLREALAVYEDKDVNEILSVVKHSDQDIEELDYAHAQLIAFFKKLDIEDLKNIDGAVDALVDEETRYEFMALFKEFTKAMDRVLPKKEALQYAEDLKTISFISQSARNRYRDEKLSIRNASEKIRRIVEDYLITHGVDPKIPPLSLFSKRFQKKVKKKKAAKSKATELESAIKEYINIHKDEDPELYERLSEKLEKLLKEYKDNWEQLAIELEALVDELQKGRENEPNFGLDRKKELPYLGLLKREIYGKKEISELSGEQIDNLVNTTKDLLEIIRREIQKVDFWANPVAQKRLRKYIASHLLRSIKDRNIMGKRNIITQQLMELTFHIGDRLHEN